MSALRRKLVQLCLTVAGQGHTVHSGKEVFSATLPGGLVALPFAVFGRRNTGEPSQRNTRLLNGVLYT